REQGKKGLDLENDILRLKGEYKFRILGPNCLGFINTLQNLNATFAANLPNKGNVAFMSQSGAIATSILDMAEEVNLGFSYFVSLGNKLDLNESDFLDIWASDKKLKSIFAYLEDVRSGKHFLQKAREVGYEKPIIVLKPGETAEGKKAISSHTGSLAQDQKIINTGFEQNGLIHVDSIQEFFNLMLIFNNFPVPFGDRIAIITNAGGPAVIATESLIKQQLQLAKFSQVTIKNLGENLPSTINIRDPLDVIGDALSDRYEWALHNLVNDKNIDTILVLLTPQFMTEIKKTANVIVKYAKQKKKLILTSFIGGVNVEKGIDILQKNKVAQFKYPSEAIKALSKLIKYEKWKVQNARRNKFYQFTAIPIHHKLKVEEIFRHKQNEYLKDAEAFKILNLYDVPTAQVYVAKNKQTAKNYLELLKYPVVMKLSSSKLIHKTDYSGVILNVKNEKELLKNFDDLVKKARKYVLEKYIEGVLIQEMLPEGLEIIIGVKKDPNFGHLLMFGSGGIYTEVYKDVAFRIIPTDKISIDKMITETKINKILQGLRGKSYDVSAIKDILIKIQQLVIDFPQISELDLNPLIIGQDFTKVVDVKIKIE
ncbi:hypothetical protein A2476_02895, partial [candidate division CPR3 bacterium RIFOXYC2_FULL_35_7]